MDVFGELLKVGGLPFALVCVALLALIRGDVVIKGSHQAIIYEKDAQIQRERERGNELWQLLQPAIVIGKASLDKLERTERDGRTKDRAMDQEREGWEREREREREHDGREGRRGGG